MSAVEHQMSQGDLRRCLMGVGMVQGCLELCGGVGVLGRLMGRGKWENWEIGGRRRSCSSALWGLGVEGE